MTQRKEELAVFGRERLIVRSGGLKKVLRKSPSGDNFKRAAMQGGGIF